jgi:hypothetical protein
MDRDRCIIQKLLAIHNSQEQIWKYLSYISTSPRKRINIITHKDGVTIFLRNDVSSTCNITGVTIQQLHVAARFRIHIQKVPGSDLFQSNQISYLRFLPISLMPSIQIQKCFLPIPYSNPTIRVCISLFTDNILK